MIALLLLRIVIHLRNDRLHIRTAIFNSEILVEMRQNDPLGKNNVKQRKGEKNPIIV